MAARNPIDPLLAVQRRRVDRAMMEVQSRNEQLRQAESDRNRANALWLEARAGLDRERRERSRVLAERMGARISGSDLVTAAARIEWWRAHVEERKRLLDSTESALRQAQTAAATARRHYMEMHAKYQAVQKLAEERRSTYARARARMEEHATDELIANRFR
jgi:flagellar biosynthesis chaperone FliJ